MLFYEQSSFPNIRRGDDVLSLIFFFIKYHESTYTRTGLLVFMLRKSKDLLL